MLCRICQKQIDISGQFFLINKCNDHLDSHLTRARKSTTKSLIESINLLKVRKLSKVRKLRENELIKQGLLINRDPNNFDIQEKKIFLDSMQIMEFDKIFGLGKEDRDYIKNITFSYDKRFSFVCIKYLGNLDKGTYK